MNYGKEKTKQRSITGKEKNIETQRIDSHLTPTNFH